MPRGGSHMIAVTAGDKIIWSAAFWRTPRGRDQQRLGIRSGAQFMARPCADQSPLGAVASPMSTARCTRSAAAGTDLKTVVTHQVLDTKTGVWSDARPLTKARGPHRHDRGGRQIHVIGGRFDEPADTTNLHEVYDPATIRGAWRRAPGRGVVRSRLPTTTA